ncbi:MAG: hypothetical protein P8R54_25880 [Myxococcota bacterium]|nr:hypothetical protein [Myxococcota bacterium]
MFLTILTATSFAQTIDLEYREGETDAQDEKLVVHGSIESQWHEFDNLDLQLLDESSDQSILDTDDRGGFGFTGGFVELSYQADKRTRMVVAASHRGLWGNDQIGAVNEFGGWLYFTGLYMEHNNKLGDQQVTARVGRQFYQLGGLAGGTEYALADVLDMVLVEVPLSDAVRLELMPAAIVGGASAYDNANFVSFLGQSSTTLNGFRGDNRTMRYGGLLHLQSSKKLNVRAYGYYTDIGALGTGSDISYNGTLANFVDNDWVANYGVRGSYKAGALRLFGALDLSSGIDRKELVARDVDTDGYAITAGLRVVPEDAGAFGRLEFYQASGATYDADGLMDSHGYTSMKARQVGGTIADRFMGWHPSAYVGMFGVTDSPHDITRISGTRSIHGRVGYQANKWRVSGAWWTLWDTATTFIDLSDLDNITPPEGYSREEFAAQERVGGMLGHEVNLDVKYNLSKKTRLFANGALFLPGGYYDIPVARVAGDQLGFDGEAVTWAASAGTEVSF